MTKVMRAVDIKGGQGPAEALFINDSVPVPEPTEGQVLVRVRAFGLNRMDLLQREGRYPVPPQAPSTLGVEFSGTITSLGPHSERSKPTFRVGDEVFGLAYGGAYAEFISVSTRMILPKPAHLTFEEAAAVPEAWLTATQALHFVLSGVDGKGGAKKSILWHAGASGVSIAGIQLSRLAGASAIFATAGSTEKCSFITSELGATAAFNYKDTEHDWPQGILDATGGKGVDLVVDFVGATYFNKNLDALARDGRIVLLGLMGGAIVDGANLGKLLMKRVRIEGSTLRSRDPAYQESLLAKLGEFLPEFESGTLKIYVDTVMPWDDIVKAHKLMESNQTKGKIVCVIPQAE